MIYEPQNISSSIQGYLLLVLTGIKNAPRIKQKSNQLLDLRRFSPFCRFTASSGSRVFYFIILITSLSPLLSGLPVIFLPSVDKVSIHLNSYLPCVIHVHNILMCHFKLFSELFRLLSFFSNFFIHYFQYPSSLPPKSCAGIANGRATHAGKVEREKPN